MILFTLSSGGNPSRASVLCYACLACLFPHAAGALSPHAAGALSPHAEDAAPPDALAQRAWEEVVVVANHLPRPAREVGSAVTLLDAGDIELRQVNLTSELLREVPGVAVNRSGQVGNVTQVRIRGAEGNHTLVLIDGIEANDPGFGSEFNFADLGTWDLDRIEVLRGPQSALYGSDAIGGVISITTAEPRPGLTGHGELEGGSFGSRQLGVSVAGGAETLAARISVSGLETDGVSASAIEPEKDGYRTGTLHGKVEATLGRHIDARLVFRRSVNEVEIDRQDFDFPPTPTEGLIIDADDTSKSAQGYGLVELRAGLLDGRWLHRAALAYTDTRSDNFASGERISGNRGERRKLEYETTLVLEDGAWHHALTGGWQRELQDFRALSADLPDANQKRSDQQTSVVAEYAVTHGRGIAASFSARRDANDRFADATTVRATGSWLLTGTGTRLHASYGEGITNPSFVELFGFVPTSFEGNPDLEPERSRSFDVGLEQGLLQGRVLADIAYFRADLTGEIVTVFDFDTFTSTVINEPGTSRRRGMELAVQAELPGGWTAGGSFTWLDAEDPDGRREVRRPRHSGSANVNYRFLDGRVNLNLVALFNGPRRDFEFVSATPATRVTLEGYTLLNAAVTYDVTERLQVFLRGENLLHESYSEVFGYRAPGRGGYLGVRARL